MTTAEREALEAWDHAVKAYRMRAAGMYDAATAVVVALDALGVFRPVSPDGTAFGL